MKRKRRKASMPIMLFWSKRDQLRFIENVERMSAILNDMQRILEPAKRRKTARAEKPATLNERSETHATT